MMAGIVTITVDLNVLGDTKDTLDDVAMELFDLGDELSVDIEELSQHDDGFARADLTPTLVVIYDLARALSAKVVELGGEPRRSDA